jgi:hypothetical protein
MTDYKQVEVTITEDEENLEPVHLSVLKMKLDLPNLNSANLPIELVQMILIIKSKPVLSDEENAQAMSVFLAYFQAMRPNFWNKLRLSDNPMDWLVSTVKAWAVESGIDPKALS